MAFARRLSPATINASKRTRPSYFPVQNARTADPRAENRGTELTPPRSARTRCPKRAFSGKKIAAPEGAIPKTIDEAGPPSIAAPPTTEPGALAILSACDTCQADAAVVRTWYGSSPARRRRSRGSLGPRPADALWLALPQAVHGHRAPRAYPYVPMCPRRAVSPAERAPSSNRAARIRTPTWSVHACCAAGTCGAKLTATTIRRYSRA